jgi:hypothetical protein
MNLNQVMFEEGRYCYHEEVMQKLQVKTPEEDLQLLKLKPTSPENHSSWKAGNKNL